MDNYEKNISALIELLYSWVPFSRMFRKDLQHSMHPQYVKPKQLLKESGSHLNSAWFSIDCWVASYHILQNGKEEVSSIYSPHEIFTDANSFLKGEASDEKLVVLSGNNLLEIDRYRFKQLRCHPELALLLEHYLLQKSQKDQWRMDLMTLSDMQKFNLFAGRYPVEQIPGKICASFLRMTPSRYSAAKTLSNRIK